MDFSEGKGSSPSPSLPLLSPTLLRIIYLSIWISLPPPQMLPHSTPYPLPYHAPPPLHQAYSLALHPITSISYLLMLPPLLPSSLFNLICLGGSLAQYLMLEEDVRGYLILHAKTGTPLIPQGMLLR